MSLNDLIASDVADVFLQVDDFAEQIIRYTDGDKSRASAITGLVTWKADDVDNFDRGRGIDRRGEVLFAESVTVSLTDQLKIGGEVYQVETVGPVHDGAFMVGVISRDQRTIGAKPLRKTF